MSTDLWVREALRQAELAGYACDPNPRVGCVLVNPDGIVIGSGHTQPVGGAHAEIMALRQAREHGHSTTGATAYVTLEPCAHHGRTGPCCDSLIQARVAHVIASCEDPNPRVGGQGFARMRAAGIAVTVGPGAVESQTLNRGFFSRMQRGRPWIRLKVAASLDGVTALPNGVSQWITSQEARDDVQQWRADASVILTGIGTLLADDPRLDVRSVETPRQPHVAVVDSRLQTPPLAKIHRENRNTIVYTLSSDAARALALKERGAHIIPCPASPAGRVDLLSVLSDLVVRETNVVHVEAGSTLNGALLEAGLVDELLLYLGPQILGPGRPMFALSPLTVLNAAKAFLLVESRHVGGDFRLLMRTPTSTQFA